MISELNSLVGELTTLRDIAEAVGPVPAEVSASIEKVLSVLRLDPIKSEAVATLLSEVTSLITAVDKLEVIPAVKEWAKQVLTLVENMGDVKPSVPASVIIQPIPVAAA